MRPSLLSADARSRFSALQRAEIAEIDETVQIGDIEFKVSVLFNEPKLLKLSFSSFSLARVKCVSVLFNEPKLLKWNWALAEWNKLYSFSALQRAEIAEISFSVANDKFSLKFQCSSTSRNC